MPNQRIPPITPNRPLIYQIRLKGHLANQWTDWFEGMDITLEENGETVLTGPVADQAALYGLFRKMRDLGLTLVSVLCIEPGSATNIAADRKTDPRPIRS